MLFHLKQWDWKEWYCFIWKDRLVRVGFLAYFVAQRANFVGSKWWFLELPPSNKKQLGFFSETGSFYSVYSRRLGSIHNYFHGKPWPWYTLHDCILVQRPDTWFFLGLCKVRGPKSIWFLSIISGSYGMGWLSLDVMGIWLEILKLFPLVLKRAGQYILRDHLRMKSRHSFIGPCNTDYRAK